MTGNELGTARLTLVVREPAAMLAWIDGMSESDRAEVSPDWLARLRAATGPDPWTCGFAMVERETGAEVGSCGYKGAPDPEGIVEIAYSVDQEHQGRGYATEAARALAAYAFATGRVRTVRAHTLPAGNASTRVLTKCGFQRLGEVMDPEDGLVWRWEIERPEAG